MPSLFRKKDDVQLPAALANKAKAAACRKANDDLDRRHAELQREIDAHAYELVESPSTALEAKIAKLEAERDGIAALKRRNTYAAAEYDRRAEEAAAIDVQRRRKDSFKELRRLSASRTKEAERIIEGLETAMSAYVRLIVTSNRMRAAWPSDISTEGAIVYEQTLLAALQHQILLSGRLKGFPKMPGGLYSREAFNVGLAKLFKQAHEHVADVLSDEAASTSRYVPPEDTPAPADIEAPASIPHPMTEGEIAANERTGNPLNLPLSGAAWDRLAQQAAAERRPNIANNVDLDPFSGQPLDPATI